jgi:hypothetical protein
VIVAPAAAFDPYVYQEPSRAPRGTARAVIVIRDPVVADWSSIKRLARAASSRPVLTGRMLPLSGPIRAVAVDPLDRLEGGRAVLLPLSRLSRVEHAAIAVNALVPRIAAVRRNGFLNMSIGVSPE